MRLLVKNIARIVGIESTGRLRCCGADMNKLGMLDDAWLLAEDGRFAAFGLSGRHRRLLGRLRGRGHALSVVLRLAHPPGLRREP